MTGAPRTGLEPPGNHHCEVYGSVREADWDEWNSLRDPQGDPFFDPRYVLAVENSLGNVCRFRHAVIRDEERKVAAIACLCSFTIDGGVLAEGSVRKVAAWISRLA